MTDGRRQFSLGSAGSAWGAAHLGPDAIVAFVDDELASGARRRALSHLSGCGQCASEVVEQTQARIFLKASSVPSTPSSLLASLRDIPSQAELPPAPAGLAVGPRGELVSMVRTQPVRHRSAPPAPAEPSRATSGCSSVAGCVTPPTSRYRRWRRGRPPRRGSPTTGGIDRHPATRTSPVAGQAVNVLAVRPSPMQESGQTMSRR
jgi:hypothetical protein